MWHRFVRWVGRRSLGWIYRDVVIADADRIPSAGPVIVIANHPNDVPDVLIGYLSTPREVHFIATISAATNALSRATYRGLGVIPVTRVRDARKLLEKGASISNVNRVAYRRVVQSLMDGNVVGVFPEGGVNTDWELRPFRPGVAQMVLQCFDDDGCQPVTIIPLGIQYESPDEPGSDCVVRVGQPLEVNRSDVSAGTWKVQTLTAELFQRLAGVTRHGASGAQRAIVDQVAAAIVASSSAHPRDGLLKAGFVAPALNSPAGVEHDILRDATLRDDVAVLSAAVESAGGRERSAADHAELYRCALARGGVTAGDRDAGTVESAHTSERGIRALRAGHPLLLAVAAPFAAIGWLVHAPLFAIVWRVALRSAESRAHRVGRAHLPGIYIVIGWYLLTAILAAVLFARAGLSSLYSLLLFMLLFRLGDVAVKWRHGFAALQFRRRVARSDDATLRDIRDRYERVRRAWDATLDAANRDAADCDAANRVTRDAAMPAGRTSVTVIS